MGDGARLLTDADAAAARLIPLLQRIADHAHRRGYTPPRWAPYNRDTAPRGRLRCAVCDRPVATHPLERCP